MFNEVFAIFNHISLEKLNDLTTKQFFGATSRKDGYMKQLLQNALRTLQIKCLESNRCIGTFTRKETKK